MIFILIFAYCNDIQDEVFNFDQYFFIIFYIPLIKHLKTVYNNHEPRFLDPELKKLALSTFFISVLLSLGLIFFFSDIIIDLTGKLLQ